MPAPLISREEVAERLTRAFRRHGYDAASLAQLEIPHDEQTVDLLQGANRQPDYLALNPLGQVPVLVDDDGTVIRDSQAILVYLARRYAPAWAPADAVTAARIQVWLSFAANEILNGPGAARLDKLFRRQAAPDIAAKVEKALGELERALSGQDCPVGERPTIADLACYPYAAWAPQGDVDLAPYPAVRAWIARIEALPRFVAPKTA